MTLSAHKLFIAAFVLTLQIFCNPLSQKLKATTTANTNTCDCKGSYIGNGISSTGASGQLSYTIKEVHVVVGSIVPNGPLTTFGWYRSTCDSIFIYDWYTVNNSFYYLAGKIIKSKYTTTISGTFKNLTDPSDYGTFIMRK